MTPRSTKNNRSTIWMEKPQWEPWSHAQTAYYHNFATALLSMFSSTYAYDLCSQLWTF